MKYLAIILLLLSFSASAKAIEQKQIDQLTGLMVVGCSLGQRVDIYVQGDGSISFLRKGVKGEFTASRSEIPAVIDFLSTDKAKGEQANNTRDCMKHYVDKIFDEILGKSVSLESSQVVITKDENGIIYQLEACKKNGRNKLECKLTVTSTFQDRKINIGARGQYNVGTTKLFDDFGNQYIPISIKLSNHVSKGRKGIFSIPLIADVPMALVLTFENISSKSKKITLLDISVRTYLNDAHQDSSIKYRNLNI